MAYQSRSIAELSGKVRAAFRRELPGTDATIAQNVLYVFAKVLAILMKEMDLRAGWLYRQLFASTADGEHLEQRHAYEFGIARKAASAAAGNLRSTGTPGLTFPAGLVYLSGGVTYRSIASVTVSEAGTVTIPVKAVATGLRTNRKAEEELALSEPGLFPGLASSAVVATGGLSGGADVESVDSLRSRVLQRKRQPPQGGAEADYERWARALPFVSRAWARRLVNGPGSVGVWFLSTGGAVPSGAEVDAVEADLLSRRLIGLRDLRVHAPTPTPVAIVIDLDPDTVETRFNVETALATVFAERVRPGLPDDPFVLSRSWISEAISDAVGEESHVLVSPAADISFGTGVLATLGTVTFA
jgi:uncharacterized phage protein gp47/JayE